MLETILRKLIPEKVSTFAKLNYGEPYHFDSWKKDRAGSPSLYYWFTARDGLKKNKKRVPVSEIGAALRQLQNAGVLKRGTFQSVCRVAESDGPCGFAVIGRILEALGVAVYCGRDGFKLTDADKAGNLLEANPHRATAGSDAPRFP